jgi:hypothetical protein
MTPKFNGMAPVALSNYPVVSVVNYTDKTTAYLTLLYDTCMGMTFNSAGYLATSWEGLTTGALYQPQAAAF